MAAPSKGVTPGWSELPSDHRASCQIHRGARNPSETGAQAVREPQQLEGHRGFPSWLKTWMGRPRQQRQDAGRPAPTQAPQAGSHLPAPQSPVGS